MHFLFPMFPNILSRIFSSIVISPDNTQRRLKQLEGNEFIHSDDEDDDDDDDDDDEEEEDDDEEDDDDDDDLPPQLSNVVDISHRENFFNELSIEPPPVMSFGTAFESSWFRTRTSKPL